MILTRNDNMTIQLLGLKGSCGELRSQINRAYDVDFINKDIYEQIYSDCRKLNAGILNFIQSLKAFESKGSKYQEGERG